MGDLPHDDQGVYGISVAGELVGMGTQTLRLYEARGLLEPERTQGGTRRYSANDLERLRHIGDLVDAGLNLIGIAMVLDLEQQNYQLRADADPLQAAEPPKQRPKPSKRSPGQAGPAADSRSHPAGRRRRGGPS
jgi:MerR family transcriptional regulator/heat shock protein HspR